MIKAHLRFESRIGNQLFQYAVTRSVAERNGYNFYADPTYWLGGDMIKVDHGKDDGKIQYTWEDTPNQEFNPEVFAVKDFTLLKGYFQSEKYFKREDVKKWFQINYPQSAYDFMKHYPVSDYCYINVRGTDQAQFSHLILPEIYYTKAIATMLHFNDKLKFLVITDDEPLARSKFPNFPVFSNDRDTDFCLLNAAKFVIGAQSTFFWWAAYLNDFNIVIAPVRWFHYHYPDLGYGPADIHTNKFIWL